MLIKSQKWIIFSLFILTISILAYKYFFIKPIAHAPGMVKVVESEKISLKNIKQTVSLIATVKAKYFTDITAKSPGNLKIIAKANEKLAKGLLIAKIEDQEIEKKYQLALSAEKLAQIQFARASSLYKSGSFSKKELEESKDNMLRASRDLANANMDFERLQFYAPFDGVVGHYKRDDGAQIINGDVIVNFYDPTKIKVEFDIPANILPDINPGQVVIIDQKNYQLTNVHKILDQEKHASIAAVDIDCSNCIIGSSINVDLVLKNQQNVIVIPFEAIFLNNGKNMVYILEDGKVAPRSVTLGIRNKKEIEIIEGLEVGEELVIKAPARLYPGMTVRISSQSS